MVDPLSPLALLPNTQSHLSIGRCVLAVAMLLAILPVALVLAAIWPEEHPVALLFVIAVLAFVLSAVGPGEHAASVHFVVEPGADEHAAVGPVVLALTLDVVVLEVTVVCASVSPGESALAVLLAMHVDAIVFGTVGPCFNTLSVLLVVMPVTLVLSPVEMAVSSVAVGLVIEPHAVIDIAVSVNEPALAIGLVVAPPALIDRAIRPRLNTLAHSNVRSSQPLAFILGLVLEDLLCFHFKLALIDGWIHTVVELAEVLTDLYDLDIMVVRHLMLAVLVGLREETTVLWGLSKFFTRDHTSDSCLEFDDEVELPMIHRVGNLLDVLQL